MVLVVILMYEVSSKVLDTETFTSWLWLQPPANCFHVNPLTKDLDDEDEEHLNLTKDPLPEK